MKINNKIIGLSLVVTASLLTGCVKDTLFDEQSPVNRQVSDSKNLFSTITEIDVVLAKDIPVQEFDKQVIEVLGNKKNLSSSDLGNLFETIGKTSVYNSASIISLDGQTFDYLPKKSGYLISKYKIVEGENEYVLDKNGYYSSLNIKSVDDNKIAIKSMITRLTALEKRKFVYQGVVNQYESYPIYVSKEENNTYKIVLIQVHKVSEKKK